MTAPSQTRECYRMAGDQSLASSVMTMEPIAKRSSFTCLASAPRLTPCRPQLGKRSPVPCKPMPELNPLKEDRFSFIKCLPDSSISEINEINWDLIIGYRDR